MNKRINDVYGLQSHQVYKVNAKQIFYSKYARNVGLNEQPLGKESILERVARLRVRRQRFRIGSGTNSLCDFG